MGSLEILVGDGSGDRGFVDLDGVRDFRHGHGFELGNSFVKKVCLTVENLAGDPLDRVLSLVNRADEEFARPHLVPGVLLFLAREDSLGHQFLVGPVDFELGDVIVVQADRPVVANPLDGRIRRNGLIRVLRKTPARGGVKLGNFFYGPVNDFGWLRKLAR